MGVYGRESVWVGVYEGKCVWLWFSRECMGVFFERECMGVFERCLCVLIEYCLENLSVGEL